MEGANKKSKVFEIFKENASAYLNVVEDRKDESAIYNAICQYDSVGRFKEWIQQNYPKTLDLWGKYYGTLVRALEKAEKQELENNINYPNELDGMFGFNPELKEIEEQVETWNFDSGNSNLMQDNPNADKNNSVNSKGNMKDRNQEKDK